MYVRILQTRVYLDQTINSKAAKAERGKRVKTVVRLLIK